MPFFILDERKEKCLITTVSSSSLHAVITLLTSSSIILIKSINNTQLAVNVNETTFLLVPCCVCGLAISLRSVSAQFPVPLCATFFTRHFFAHVFVYMPVLLPIIMFPVISQFHDSLCLSVSSLSLLGPCVEGGQCFLSTPCG